MRLDITTLSPEIRKQVLDKLSAEDRQKFEKEAKGSKYHAQKTDRANITFDSKREAERYDELVLLLRAGEIRNLKLQPTFTLQESYVTPKGERIRAIKYVADFSYETAESRLVVEDVKSKATRTKAYIIKRKLMQEKFGITITEV